MNAKGASCVISVAIVEDDDYFASTISKYLDQYAREYDEEI